MKRALVVLILAGIAIGAGLYLFFHSSSERHSGRTLPPHTGANPTETSSTPPAGASPTTTAVSSVPEGPGTPARSAAAPPPIPFLFGSPDTPPAMDPATVL